MSDAIESLYAGAVRFKEHELGTQMTRDNEIELKPCPFCGGAALVLVMHKPRFQIACSLCSATTTATTANWAAKDWNRRAEPEKAVSFGPVQFKVDIEYMTRAEVEQRFADLEARVTELLHGH